MFIDESRSPRGVGFLALQDHGWRDAEMPLDLRSMVGAVRVSKRFRGLGNLGEYEYPEESLGDVIGSFLWESAADDPDGGGGANSREIPGWRMTPWPVRTKEAGIDIDATSDPVARCVDFDRDEIKMLPLYKWEDPGDFGEGGATLDDRFMERDVQVPQQGIPWPSALFPKPWLDCYGIAVSMDNEGQQDDLFLQTDPRLIAPNIGGDPTMGSLVADLQKNCKISKVAPLQSAFRVATEMRGCVNSGPFLAWQIGMSGCGDTLGGVVWDTSIGGFLSQALGSGPLTCGPVGDKHKVAQTEIGIVNSCHISTNAYYLKDEEYDAPLKFDDRWEGAGAGPLSVEVFLEYDDELKHPHVCEEKDGMWRWRAATYIERSTPTGIPGPSEGMPIDPGQPVLDIPGKPVDIWLNYEPTIGQPRPLSATWGQAITELGMPGLVFQPQFFKDGAADFRTWGNPSRELIDRQKADSPMTARLESFGRQTATAWSYYNSPASGREPRYPRGSAHGGIAFMPPQIGIGEYMGLDPDGDPRAHSIAHSTAAFVISDAARLALGTPSTDDDGGISAGFYQAYDASTSLLGTYLHDDTRYLYMEATGSQRIIFDQPVEIDNADGMTIDGDLSVDGDFTLGKGAVQISGNDIDPSSAYASVQAASGLSSGSVYTIDATGVSSGQMVILSPYVITGSAHSITFSEGSGYYTTNISLPGGSDITISACDHLIAFIYDDTGGCTAGRWVYLFSKTS